MDPAITGLLNSLAQLAYYCKRHAADPKLMQWERQMYEKRLSSILILHANALKFTANSTRTN